MRIVDRTELAAMPKGTLYHSYRPYVLGPLSAKMSRPARRAQRDWYEWEPGDPSVDDMSREDLFDWLERDREISAQLSRSISREGGFDDDDLFIIYEPADVAELVKTVLFAHQE